MKDNTFQKAISRLENDLNGFIEYLESTKSSEWYLHKVRNKTNTRNCLYGHLINWYYGKDYDGDISPMWDAFEEMSSSYYVYPINDGKNPEYPQKTARERCIALMKDYDNGKLWTWQAMTEEINKLKARELLVKVALA